MPTGLHFPFRFSPELLRADLAIAQSVAWPPHYNQQDYGGNWTGIALRSSTGHSHQLVAGGNAAFTDTELLDRCAYFRQVLSVFQCPLKSVRLLSLAPQSFIREHSDHALGYDDGEIRIHIPIQTSPDVEFYVVGERLLLEEGHSYFINVNLPHRVNNRGTTDRIHLVIDAEVNDWVHALFRQAAAEHWAIPRSQSPPRNVDDFRRHVLADDALQQNLQAIEDPRRFAEAVLEMGSGLGFHFHDGDLGAALRCGPLAHIAGAGFPADLRGWTPVRIFFRDFQPMAEWIFTGTRRFTESFFEASVKAALRRPFAKFFRRDMPLAVAAQIPPEETLAPSGFIFHVSRCGSTLISQMLAAVERHVVISEAVPIDELLQMDELLQAENQEQVQWLRWLVAALGQRRSGIETGYFLKFDAWHIHNLPLIRAAFPDTPWIFVYRDPLEVMVSQLSRPGRFSIPGMIPPSAFALNPGDIEGLTPEAYCARILAPIFQAGLSAKQDPLALLVHYPDLPEAVFDRIASHFSLRLTDAEMLQMRAVTAFNAKTPRLWFEADSEQKQSAASPVVRALCAAWLSDTYRKLLAG
jgi:hypothetical protein